MGAFGEVALLVLLVAGGICGTFLSRWLFGRPVDTFLASFELAIYTLFAVLLASFAPLFFSGLASYFSYFVIGLVSVVIAGLVVTFAGFKSDRREPKSIHEMASKHEAAERVFSCLLDAGFPRSSAKQCLHACGFSSETVEKVFRQVKRGSSPHPLVLRVASLEEQLRGKRGKKIVYGS